MLAREDVPGDKRLVAYLAVKEGEPPTDLELRDLLRSKLPEYMVPSAFVVLDRFPLTPNGKVDRNALPSFGAAAFAVHEYEAPASELEIRLAQIWAEALKVQRIGRHDNFFELGGHSLLAVKLIERMRRAGLQIEVRALFATPTVAEVAATVGIKQVNVEVPINRIPNTSKRIDVSGRVIEMRV